MIVKVKFIETVWDNYQGASGMPIKRSMIINIPNETAISEIENLVMNTLTHEGIKSDYQHQSFQYKGLLSIEILPTINIK